MEMVGFCVQYNTTLNIKCIDVHYIDVLENNNEVHNAKKYVY